MIPKPIQDACDACGFPVREGGWYPNLPPAGNPYVELDDVERIDFDDSCEIYATYHAVTIRLYSLDAAGPRVELRDALFEQGVPVTNIEVTGQSYETKQFETVFSVAGEYTQKWRKNQ